MRLNTKGAEISLELALNSRCTSDYNGHQKIFHWGMFDPGKSLIRDEAGHLVQLVKKARIKRFTDGLLEIKSDDNILTFMMADEKDNIKRSWMMIESGMQQQIICLLCAAYGVGMVFKSMGDDGRSLSETFHGNTQMRLDAMQESYDGSYWCTSRPVGQRNWREGNLPEPDRIGREPLVALLQKTANPYESKVTAGNREIGQLLWAARGRTPHFYKSRPWGMTIPVSRGDQTITSLFLYHNGTLYRYENWLRGRPTHALEEKRQIDIYKKGRGNGLFINNCHIILNGNEATGRSLWEIGYQLINIILQARALNVNVFPLLLDDKKRESLRLIGINNGWCIISIPASELAL